LGGGHGPHGHSRVADTLCDFEGSLADLNEAIRLSEVDNDDNASWNNCAKSMGFASQTAFYELLLPTEDQIYLKRAHRDEYKERLQGIKRRDK
jgi:hypothetical protein